MRSTHRRLVSWRPWVRPVAVVLAGGVGFFAVAAHVDAADDGSASGKGAAQKPAAAEPAEKKNEGAAGPDDAAERVTYAKHVQPILKDSCVQCHKMPAANSGRGPGARGPGGPGGPGGPRGPAGGLRLDDKAMILKGGKHGNAVIPGKGEESLLYKVLKEPVTIEGDEIHAMPKAKPGTEFTPINDDEIELVKKWIDQGAK